MCLGKDLERFLPYSSQWLYMNEEVRFSIYRNICNNEDHTFLTAVRFSFPKALFLSSLLLGVKQDSTGSCLSMWRRKPQAYRHAN